MKKVTKTEEVIETPKEVKPKVKLISYSVKMVIPTGAYANVQPEITVKAASVEEADKFITPHMARLWREYYMVNERPQAPVVKAQVPQYTPIQQPSVVASSTSNVVQTIPVGSVPLNNPVEAVALNKATQAIEGCKTQEALDMISAQIKKSVRLSDPEKDKLYVVLINKQKEINGNGTK